jgi:hypothetical protein
VVEFLGTEDFLEKLQGLMDRAKKAVPAGSVYARRVDLLDQGILQLILTNRRHYAGSEMAQLPAIPEMDVPIGAAPQVDGQGDDLVWQSGTWQEITRTHMNQEAAAGARFKAVADRDTLYLLAECREPFTENIVAQMEGRGPAVLSDDSLEIFLDEDPADGQYYHLGYNTRGSVFESWVDRTGTEKGAADWKSDSRAWVTIHAHQNWTAEIAIPWPNVSGGPVVAGQTWRLNVCRNRRTTQDGVEYTNWSVCGGGFHNPARFGRMTFHEGGNASGGARRSTAPSGRYGGRRNTLLLQQQKSCWKRKDRPFPTLSQRSVTNDNRNPFRCGNGGGSAGRTGGLPGLGRRPASS